MNDRMPGSQVVSLVGDVEGMHMQETHLVVFALGEQSYALPIDPVQQIVEMVTIIPVPQENRLVEGVINVRGAMVPVVNLGSVLGLAATPLDLHTPIVLIQTHGHSVGLIVDQVRDVLTLSVDRILQSSDVLPDNLNGAPLIAGVARTAEGAALLLDVEHLFTSKSVGLAEILEYLSKVGDLGQDSERQRLDEDEEVGT